VTFAAALAIGCGTTKPDIPPPPSPEEIRVLQLEAKAAQLVQTTNQLYTMQNKADELKRRLTAICVDYPDHLVCQPQTAAAYARAAFCSDQEFTSHVDSVVSACHQGQCKQLDEASLLKRNDYMTLVRRLPHSLVLFRAKQTKLDRKDRTQLQHFIEQIGADGGYIIIVGRASRDGPWRKNLRYALERAENTRRYVVEQLGFEQGRVGYITYGHEKMYLTDLDVERLSQQKISPKRANRSAFVFAYPCFEKTQPRAQF